MSSFLYLFLMQGLLYYSMRDFGKHTETQAKISKATIVLILLVLISKLIYMLSLGITIDSATFTDNEKLFKALGYTLDQETDAAGVVTYSFAIWECVNFEIMAIALNMVLLVYYNGQTDRRKRKEHYHYIHNSIFLSQNKKLQHIFFFSLVVDTFFSQTIIQAVVLALMIFILFYWAISDTPERKASKDVAIMRVTKFVKFLIYIELIFLAFFQISYALDFVKGYDTLYTILFSTGLIFNYEASEAEQITHTMLLCLILSTGYFFDACRDNFNNIPLLTATNQSEEAKSATNKSTKKKTIIGSLKKFDYAGFVKTYLPYVCLWICRFCSIIIAYAYFGYTGFVVLSWILFSFILPTYFFVKWSSRLYVPVFIAAVLYEFVINIQLLFHRDTPGPFSRYKKNGITIKNTQPIEICGMVTNIVFLLVLLSTQKDIVTQRNEFKEKIFSKLANEKSNLFWQLSFYVVKRIHIVLLFLIFVFGMSGINVYYIGLLYFFIKYVSSLKSYRVAGPKLVAYAAFFIWTQYLWQKLNEDNVFEKSGLFYEIMTMVTLQTAPANTTTTISPVNATNDGQLTIADIQETGKLINSYLEKSIPYAQWIILLINVFMMKINKFFKKEPKPIPLPGFEGKKELVMYESKAEFYEAKNDFILMMKFPTLAKIFIRIRMILSEVMILGILIVQSLVLAFQAPNLLFWGFLIISLILQTSVVSAGINDQKMFKQCIFWSKSLKLYSGIILISQIAYHFINDPRLVGQYGWDEQLNKYLKDAGIFIYMQIIGFKVYSREESTNIAVIFMSPIVFYITSSILKDYFRSQMTSMKEAEDEEKAFKEMLDKSELKKEASSVAQLTMSRSTLNMKLEEDFKMMDDKEKIEFEYVRVRFTVPYLIYQRLEQWRLLDWFALNFHLINATVTVILCTNWQISLSMYLYLIITISLCMKATFVLYKNAKGLKGDQDQQKVEIKKKEDEMREKRNYIDTDNFSKEYRTIDQAHRQNKKYMLQASKNLLKVRQQSWKWQYWILIFTMILMYPTPLFTKIVQLHVELESAIADIIYWLFWSGIYISPYDAKTYQGNMPLYIMITMLVIEKICQKWQENRYGCTISRIREFKKLDEEIDRINKSLDYKPINQKEDDTYEKTQKTDADYITIMEAKNECARIESLYREQTPEIKENKLKEELILGLKRKYTIEYRSALKFIIEQISLQLLLFSCAHKSNFISILYLGLLLTLLLVKKKSTGMRIISFSIGIALIFEYFLTLSNLSYANSPMAFPDAYEYYPCLSTSTAPWYSNSTSAQKWEATAGAQINCNNTQVFAVPWYLNSELLKTDIGTNFPWALFWSIDVQLFKVNDMWFDFANLILLTVYFFSFGDLNQAKNEAKISFSKTSRLEKSLKQYSKIQQEKQNKLIKELEGKDGNSVVKNILTNTHEKFLGPTYYLMRLKRKIFIYNFTKQMKVLTFVGAQVMTAILIFVIAVLHRSIMSIGYLIFCIILLWNMKDFFYQEKLQRQGRQWINPYIISRPLLFFSFLDIALQILYQIPYMPPQSPGNTRYLGFDKIYKMNDNVNTFGDIIGANGQAPQYVAELEVQNLFFLVLKAMNLFFIFLQTRIYQSDGFSKFLRVDLRALMNMGNNYKKYIMAQIYNNQKLEQIIQVQQKKKHMYKKLEELKDQVLDWKKQQSSLLTGYFDKRPTAEAGESLLNNLTTGLLTKKFALDNENSAVTQITMQKVISKAERLSMQKEVALNELNKNFKMELLRVLNEDDPNYDTKKRFYKHAKTQLGRCSRLYLWINKKYVNQVLFIETVDQATKTKEETSKGILKQSNALKDAMKRDINFIVESKIALQQKSNDKQQRNQKIETKISLNEMPDTSEFVTFSRISVAVISAIPKALLSQSASLAYIFMILSMILNAGLISILYPFAVFGYALMEEGRPGRHFWNLMSYYTVFILFMKLILQLDIWFLIDIAPHYNEFNSWMIIGLIRVEGILELAVYILPEFLVLSCVWAQAFYEILIGLHDQREIEIENIKQARERFLGQFNEQAKKLVTTLRLTIKQPKKSIKPLTSTIKEEAMGEDGLTDKQRSHFYIAELKNLKTQQVNGGVIGQQLRPKLVGIEDFAVYEQKDGERKEIEDFVNLKSEEMGANISLIINSEERHERAKQIRLKNLSGVESLVKTLAKKNYFRTLFPLIKEQKPGKDMYAAITFWQFVICFFLINFYTKLDARGTQNLETTNQFSFYMVIILFVQIAVMIIERFISRTNTRINKVGKDADKKLQSQLSNGSLLSQTMKMTSKTQKATTIPGTIKSVSDQEEYSKLQQYTQLTVTKMTFQQILKWIIQIILLIFYHWIIFWLFPLSSNDAIYGTATCDRTTNSFQNYGCYDFKENLHLIIFYCIFCYYFMLSALQIRHGYPDWKNPSSLTSVDNAFHQNGNLIFYSLPFLLELKTVLDWCFTKTSLDIFQWLELTEINHAMFNSKNSNQSYYNRKLGTKISSGEKRFCGCFCVSVMLFFLVGPFLFFSDLRWIANYNSVTDMKVGLTLSITEQFSSDDDNYQKYEFPLFQSNNPLSINNMAPPVFEALNYSKQPETKFFELEQVQVIKMKNTSDEIWAASLDDKYLFRELLGRAANVSENITVEAQLSFEFQRPLPETARTTSGNLNYLVTDVSDFQRASQVDCFANPNEMIKIQLYDFIAKRIRLGETATVSQLLIDDPQVDNYNDVTLWYSCQNYWILNNATDQEGIDVEVFNDVISTGFFSSTSILGFYFGLAMTVGTLFRTIVMYKTDRIFVTDSRDTDKIRNLIACIFRQRLEQNLKKEEELFFLLYEILRNPQLFTHITGESWPAKLTLPEEPKKAPVQQVQQ